MNKRIYIVLASTLFIFACSQKSEFEKFSYEMCVKEGKYPDKICSCSAKNLDATLTDEEKKIYKKAALGDMSSALSLFKFLDKIQNATLKCAD
jgi:hypothetical protein